MKKVKIIFSLCACLYQMLVSVYSSIVNRKIRQLKQQFTIHSLRFQFSTFHLQVVTINMEIFVWWEEPTAGREEWRYISMENGELFHATELMHLMLMLYVDNLAMTLDVS